MLKSTALAFALAFGLIGTAQAGDQYVDQTGFAASGYDVVSYFGLPQSALGGPQPAPLPGSAAITAEYNGATFAFATEANRDAFVANPAAYAPQYDGHCAYGVAKGAKVPANPTLWRIVGGKLYLNITEDVVGQWEQDIPGHLSDAERNWGQIEADAASDDTIPGFVSAAPLAR